MKEIVWSYTVGSIEARLVVEPEIDNPADHFSEKEDVEAIYNGDVLWFAATLEIIKNGHIIGCDSLGACSYYSISEFISEHRNPDPLQRNSSIMRNARGQHVAIGHPFTDMVRCAVADARKTIA